MTEAAEGPFDLASAMAKYKSQDLDLKYPALALLYGPPGCGKTHTALTASKLPGVNKMLYLDTEGSTIGVANRFDLSKVDIVRVDEHENPIAFLNTIITHIGNGASGYDAYALDTLDVAQDMYIKQLKAQGADSWEMWSEVADWTTKIAITLKRSPGFGVLVLHDKTDSDPTGAVSTLLRLSGSSKDVLPGKADMVAYMERKLDKEDKKVHTFAHLEVSDRKVTKNKFDFPAYVKDISFPGLWKYIDNHQREES